jgi:hypothetical protein
MGLGLVVTPQAQLTTFIIKLDNTQTKMLCMHIISLCMCIHKLSLTPKPNPAPLCLEISIIIKVGSLAKLLKIGN